MDQCDDVEQNLLDSKHESDVDVVKQSNVVYSSPQKPGVIGCHNLETEFASQTPQKTSESLNIKSEDDGEYTILQRHKAIVEFFDAMVCSVRLLGLQRKSPTFRNIRCQVDVLTGRSFSHGQLAQLKYLLPEVIQIDKILVHDKSTLCMKPDMKIILLFDVVEGHHEQSDFIAVRQLCTSRLVNYFTENIKACDIPEAMLPDPFNQSEEAAFRHIAGDVSDFTPPELSSQPSQNDAPEQLSANASAEDLLTMTDSSLLSRSSHMHPSFSRYFSEKIATEEKTQPLATPGCLSSAESCGLKNEDGEIVKTKDVPDMNPKGDLGTNPSPMCDQVKDCPGIISESTNVNKDYFPIQPTSLELSIESPLCKLVSSSHALLIETPAQSTPSRGIPSCDDNHKSIGSQKQSLSSKAAKRSLNFSFLESEKLECSEYLSDNISRALDCSRVLFPKIDEGVSSAAEERTMYQSEPVHNKISNRSSGLVSLIHQIFHSINYSSITKEELVHKIIITSFDFDDRRQVEEQIEILEKQVPDWICRKLAPSGDALYSIKKMLDLKCVQSRVASI